MILQSVAIALASAPVSAPEIATTQIGLLRQTIGYSVAAPEIFLCKGMRRNAAREAASRALGHDFDRRLKAAYELLSIRYGQDAVREGTEVIATGWRQTPERCRIVATYIAKAKDGLASLEKMNGVR